MKRNRRGALYGVLLGLFIGCSGARAEDRSDALGPDRIGASLEDVLAILPLACGGSAPARTCTVTGGRFLSVPVKSIEARFDRDRLVRVVVRFEPSGYPVLLEDLRRRLGEPEDRTYRARAGMAGDFVVGVKVWETAAFAAVLEELAGKIDRGALTFGDPAAMRELLARQRAYPPGAMRDL